MKPKIKSVHTYVINDFTPEEGLLSVKQVNNENGNLLLQEQYALDGRIEQKIERAYDSEQRLVEEKQYTEGDAPHQVISNTYDENGKLNRSTTRYMDGALSNTDFVYDLSARSEEMTTRDEAGQIEEKVVRSFDQEGRVLEQSEYGEEESFVKSVKSSYNDAGRPLERHYKTEETEYKHFYDYEYDEEGRITYAEIFDVKEDLIRTDEITYDERGNQKEVAMKNYADGWSIVDRYTYNEQDQLVKEERFMANGDPVESKEYQMDEHGFVLQQEVRNRNGWTIHRYQYEFFEATTS
ncbi:MAG: hypothetical protein AAF985_11285 [Bacteroidota bacterium]